MRQVDTVLRSLPSLVAIGTSNVVLLSFFAIVAKARRRGPVPPPRGTRRGRPRQSARGKSRREQGRRPVPARMWRVGVAQSV